MEGKNMEELLIWGAVLAVVVVAVVLTFSRSKKGVTLEDVDVKAEQALEHVRTMATQVSGIELLLKQYAEEKQKSDESFKRLASELILNAAKQDKILQKFEWLEVKEKNEKREVTVKQEGPWVHRVYYQPMKPRPKPLPAHDDVPPLPPGTFKKLKKQMEGLSQ